MRWGFAAETVVAFPPGGDAEEWTIATEQVMAADQAEVTAAASLACAPPWTKGRISGAASKSLARHPLGRILSYLLQEYSRHVGHLDVARTRRLRDRRVRPQRPPMFCGTTLSNYWTWLTSARYRRTVPHMPLHTVDGFTVLCDYHVKGSLGVSPCKIITLTTTTAVSTKISHAAIPRGPSRSLLSRISRPADSSSVIILASGLRNGHTAITRAMRMRAYSASMELAV
ncbi:hypothetical protein [Streptomyces cacaoi]